jgi:hypothetical protein
LKGLGVYRAMEVAASHARLVRQEFSMTSRNFSSLHFFPVMPSNWRMASRNWPFM